MAAPAPPDGSGSSGGPRRDILSPEDSDQAKAKLDDTELGVGSPRAMQKVELDLDDAPFLEEEIVVPPAAEVPTAPPPQEIEEAAPPRARNKKLLLAALGGILLFLCLTVWWFFLRKPKEIPAPPPPPPVEEPKPAPPKPEEPAPPPPPKEVSLSLEPFVVEKTDDKGHTKILTLKIELVYKEDPRLAQELQAKSLALRDGVYYNLKNKSFGNLTDKKSVEALREELKGVVNNYLNTGQVDQVLFEELLVK